MLFRAQDCAERPQCTARDQQNARVPSAQVNLCYEFQNCNLLARNTGKRAGLLGQGSRGRRRTMMLKSAIAAAAMCAAALVAAPASAMPISKLAVAAPAQVDQVR